MVVGVTFRCLSVHSLSIVHTIGIGVHHLQCNKTDCRSEQYQYHSCGNRHCPNCGGLKKEQWLQDRICELLPTTYFHLVFTLPQELRSLVMGSRKVLFKLLFDAGHHNINTLSSNKKWLGAKPGIISILHTISWFHKNQPATTAGLSINATKPPRPGVAEQRIAKSPDPNGSGLLRDMLTDLFSGGLSAIRLNVGCRFYSCRKSFG